MTTEQGQEGDVSYPDPMHWGCFHVGEDFHFPHLLYKATKGNKIEQRTKSVTTKASMTAIIHCVCECLKSTKRLDFKKQVKDFKKQVKTDMTFKKQVKTDLILRNKSKET